MKDEKELVLDLSNGAISNDLEWPLTQISRPGQYLTLIMDLADHI